jgi:hypothetical protein
MKYRREIRSDVDFRARAAKGPRSVKLIIFEVLPFVALDGADALFLI